MASILDEIDAYEKLLAKQRAARHALNKRATILEETRKLCELLAKYPDSPTRAHIELAIWKRDRARKNVVTGKGDEE